MTTMQHGSASRAAGRTPRDVLRQLRHARIEYAPTKARKLGSAFWVAAGLPDFAKLPGLIQLTMYGVAEEVHLPELFRRVGECETLEDLALVSSKHRALPDDLTSLRRLYSLTMKGTALCTLPPSIGQLQQLEELWLLDSPVGGLPDALGSLRKMKILRLGGASFEPAPLRRMPALDGAPELEHLTLANMPELEETAFLGRLPSLRALELVGRVTARGIPDELSALAKLRALALSDAVEVPRAIAGLRALEVLYLVKETCTRVPAWLPELTGLRYLAVFGNRDFDAGSIIDAAVAMPWLARIFLPFPFDPRMRERLKRLGFVTDRGNPCIMNRTSDEAPVEDPFLFLR
jgi:hypothetical protein